MNEFPLLTTILCIPLLSLLLLICLKSAKLYIVRRAAIAFAILPIPPIIFLFYETITNEGLVHFAQIYHWLAFEVTGSNKILTYAFSLGVTGLQILLMLLSAVVIVIASIAGIYVKKRQHTYYSLLLLLQTGALGLCMAMDALLLISFFFLVVICFYFIIGIWGKQHRIEAANQYIKAQLIGGFSLLTSLLILQATDHPQIEEYSNGLFYLDAIPADRYIDWFASPLVIASLILMLLGILFITPIVGISRWYIALFRESHPISVLLYAGIQMGLNLYISYTLLTTYFPQFIAVLTPYIIILFTAQCLISAVLMWRQQHLQQWIGLALLGQIGIGWIAFCSLSVQGLTAAFLHMISFSLIAVLLLLSCAVLHERLGNLQISELYGLSRFMPFFNGILLLGILAMSGTPGSSQFISHFLTLIVAFEKNMWIGVLLLCALTLLAINGIKCIIPMFSCKPSYKLHTLNDMRFVEAFPVLLLLAIIMLIGLYPVTITEMTDPIVIGLSRFYHEIAAQSSELLISSSFILINAGNPLGAAIVVFSCVMMIGSLVANGRRQSLRKQWYWHCLIQSMIPIAYIGYIIEQQMKLEWQPLLFYIIMHSMVLSGSLWIILHYTRYDRAMGKEALSGLYYRQPLIALVMLVLLLSLIGLPFTSLFKVKLWLWSSMIMNDGWLLAIFTVGIQLGAIMTYIGIIAHMYMRGYEPERS